MSYYSEVMMNVEDYFRKNLKQYTVLDVRNKSIFAEDYFLFMVSAIKEDGSYAVWSCWNNETMSLNHGHYGLKTLEDCEKIFAENYNDGK